MITKDSVTSLQDDYKRSCIILRCVDFPGRQLFPNFRRISYGLGQHYHPFYAISRGLGNISCRRNNLPTTGIRARNPIFDAPFWSENGVSCPHERNKIGDSVLWLGCYDLCNKFARWLQKINRALIESTSKTHAQSCFKNLRPWQASATRPQTPNRTGDFGVWLRVN